MTNLSLQSNALHLKAASRVLGKAREHARQLMANWQARAVIARLDRLDDKLLHDAGLDRSDIEWAKQLPLTVDAEQALYQHAGRH